MLNDQDLNSLDTRFCLMILFYDCEQFILRTIDNCADFVEKIYISYSPVPWNAYNTTSRKGFHNNSDINILKTSRHYAKIEVLTGEWQSEEEQREECRIRAKCAGFNYLIVQDADEFYQPSEFRKNLSGIIANPDHEVYQCPWVVFWKTFNYVLVEREHQGLKKTIYGTNQLFAVNLDKDVYFESRRVPLNVHKKDVFRLAGICLHLSYILSDTEIFNKINTWGHSHQVRKGWYKYKWLAWTPSTRFLNPMNVRDWYKAIPYRTELPQQLKDFAIPEQKFLHLSFRDNIISKFYDLIDGIRDYSIAYFRKLKSSYSK